MPTPSRHDLTALLSIRHPIIQAPMGGGGANPPELVAAVCNAGALGSLGAAYLAPEQIREAVTAIRRLTDRPFNVNLFAGGREHEAETVDPAPMLAVLARFHDALGLSAPEVPAPGVDPFEAQLEVVLEMEVPVFSFTFGIPDGTVLGELKRRGIVTVGTATTVAEAERLEAAGVDAVVAQGSEAGGHRGTFAAPFEAALVGTMALVPQVVDAVRIPVIASGGIMDGRGIVAARALGAAAVQMGTAFLTVEESGIPEAYKQKILDAADDATVVTRAFSGRPARGIANGFIRDTEGAGVAPLPFPVQNALTRPMRNAAAKRDDPDALSLWAGQASSLARRETAAELIARLVEESEATAARLALP